MVTFWVITIRPAAYWTKSWIGILHTNTMNSMTTWWCDNCHLWAMELFKTRRAFLIQSSARMILEFLLKITRLTGITMDKLFFQAHHAHFTPIAVEYRLSFIWEPIVEAADSAVAPEVETAILTFCISYFLNVITFVTFHRFHFITRELVVINFIVVTEAAWEKILAYRAQQLAATDVVFTSRGFTKIIFNVSPIFRFKVLVLVNILITLQI